MASAPLFTPGATGAAQIEPAAFERHAGSAASVWIEVADNGMADVFQLGDRVLADPEVAPGTGHVVAVHLIEMQRVVVRVLAPSHPVEMGPPYRLLAINPAFPAIEVTSGERARLLGVVIELSRVLDPGQVSLKLAGVLRS